MESRNAKFLENDLVSGSGQFHDNLFERDHYQGQDLGPSHRLTIIHTHRVESGIRQPIIQDPRTSRPIDHIIEDQQNVEQQIEQPVEQQVPDEETMLRRSTRSGIQLFLVIMLCTYKNRITISSMIQKRFHKP